MRHDRVAAPVVGSDGDRIPKQRGSAARRDRLAGQRAPTLDGRDLVCKHARRDRASSLRALSAAVLLALISANAVADVRSGNGVVGYETAQGLEPGAQMAFSVSFSRYGADQDPTYGTALYTDTGPDSSLDMVAGSLRFHCPGVFVTAQNDVPSLGDLIVLGGNACELTGGADAADLRVWVLFEDPAGGALQGPEVRATLPVNLAHFPASSMQVRGCFESGCDGYDFIITGSLSSFGPIVVPEPPDGAGTVGVLALVLLHRKRVRSE